MEADQIKCLAVNREMASTASAAAAPTVTERATAAFSQLTVTGGISLFLFVVAIAFLGGNIGLLSKLAGSKDDWDTIKSQMGGSIAMSFIGAAVFAVALSLYVSQYNLGNLMVPMLLNIIIGCTALAVGLSAMSVAAITR
jgi:hypothetical protein